MNLVDNFFFVCSTYWMTRYEQVIMSMQFIVWQFSFILDVKVWLFDLQVKNPLLLTSG